MLQNNLVSNTFINSLQGLTLNDSVKAKEFLIKNAISEYKMMQKQLNYTLLVALFFTFLFYFLYVSLITLLLFWAVLIVFSINRKLRIINMREQIYQVLELWNEELGERKQVLENTLITFWD